MSDTDVLVVGAGPTGLTLACVLAGAGVRVRLVDQRNGPTDQSRAAIVHVRTLEYWDQLGIAGPAIATGVPIREVRVAIAGRALARFSLARPGPGLQAGRFDHALALPQHRTERLLGEALQARGGHIVWRSRLVELEGTGGVVAGDGGSTERVRARFVVGTDGAGSLVRTAAGIEFPGSAYAPMAFLADVRLDPPPVPGAVHLNLAKGGFVGILALGQDRFRLFGALPQPHAVQLGNLHEGREVRQGDLQRWFDEYFGVSARVSNVGWTSTYRVHHRLATAFRAGNVFLAGDAAHVHAPAGGQGMNLGIGDAINLGWKLAAVITGRGRPALLDSYEPERRAVAESVLRYTDRGFELEATANRALELARRTILPFAVTVLARLPIAQHAIFRLFAQTWIHYRSSMAVTQALPARGRGPRAGDRIPPDLLATSGALRHRPILVTTGSPRDADATRVENLVRRYVPSHPVHTINLDSPAGRRLTSGDASRIVLARPDGHAGYIGPAYDLAPLEAYLARWFHPPHGVG